MNIAAPKAKLRLKDRVAVVTGGSRGIGEGIVKRFVEYRECRRFDRRLWSSRVYGSQVWSRRFNEISGIGISGARD
jgi:hypothetical protein